MFSSVGGEEPINQKKCKHSALKRKLQALGGTAWKKQTKIIAKSFGGG